MTEDLATWLLEQIAAKEREASRLAALIADGYFDERDDEFRRDPSGELAECDAKRRIVAKVHNTWDRLHPDHADNDGDMGCVGCGFRSDSSDRMIGHVDKCPVLRALAQPYAHRPGYRPEWKP